MALHSYSSLDNYLAISVCTHTGEWKLAYIASSHANAMH